MVVDVDRLEVRLNGPDRVLALKSRLDVPLSQVSSVDVVERRAIRQTPGTWLRKPGTHIPGLIRHGSYGLQPEREFWALYRQRYALVIDVAGWTYSRLILGAKDAPLHAAEIRSAAEAHHPLAG